MTTTQQLQGIDIVSPIADSTTDLPDYESAIAYIAATAERDTSSEGAVRRKAGEMWERLVAEFFRSDPVYRRRFAKVSLWREFSDKADTGIDAVAETFDGKKIAIQCKFSGDPDRSLQKGAIDSFIAETDTKEWAGRYVVWSGFKVSPHIDNQIAEDRAVPLNLLTGAVLRTTNTNWSELATTGKAAVKAVPPPWKHQTEAVSSAVAALERDDRAKLVMACGSGKTFTSQMAAEKIAGIGKTVLFCVPSIALMGQTMRSWAEREDEEGRGVAHKFLGVCSDAGVGKKDTEDIGGMHKTDIAQLEMSVKTDADAIADALKQPVPEGSMRTVFSTYQSLPKIKEAQKKHAAPAFDLVFCDEAHRTTGISLEGAGYFQLPHNDEDIASAKRIYMTATPKVFSEPSAKKAERQGKAIWHMGDETIYGEEVYKLSFSKAISDEVLVDYKVHIIQVAEDTAQEILNRFIQQAEEHGWSKSERNAMLKTDVAARMVGLWQALTGDEGCRTEQLWKSITFLNTVRNSKAFSKIFPVMCDYLNELSGKTVPVRCQHVDGTMSATTRQQHLSWLDSAKLDGEIRVLSNAKCLTEGVDVPSLDAVNFMVPKGSIVDIVQSVGRVMRDVANKRFGHVVVPAVLPLEMKKGFSGYLKSDAHWKTTWNVLRALRSHDDRFASELAVMEVNPDEWPERIVCSVTDNSESLESVCFAGGGDPSFSGVRDGSGEVTEERAADGGEKAEGDATWDMSPASESTRSNTPDPEWLASGGKPQHAAPTSSGAAGEGEQQTLSFADMLRQFPAEVLKMLQENIAVTMLDKVGDRQYWDTWGQDAAKAYRQVKGRLERHRDSNIEFADEIRETAAALAATLGALGTEEETIATLAQYFVIKPVFKALFGSDEYFSDSPLSKAMNRLAETVEILELDNETAPLSEFYSHVAEKAATVKKHEHRQQLIKHLYQDFIRTVFPAEAKKFGVVYTPNEIVDFILRSVDWALKEHLHIDDGIASEEVNVLDPFAGTGTFLVNLIANSDLLPDDKLKHKYLNNLHSTEIMALPYWATELNMEQAYIARTGGKYLPYKRGVLADTFSRGEKQMTGKISQQKFEFKTLKENISLAEAQDETRIKCIVGNPPWAVENTGEWEVLEQRIADTYANEVDISNKNALYDSYILALRWASDRIGERGVVGFVTNNSYLTSNVGAGVRRTFEKEFDHIYVLNLRGKGGAGVSPEQRVIEGDNLFNVTVGNSVVILVKTGENQAESRTSVLYGDTQGLSASEKKTRLINTYSVGDTSGGVEWEEVISDYRGDWIEQGHPDWPAHWSVGNSDTKKSKTDSAIFRLYSRGLATGMAEFALGSVPEDIFDRGEELCEIFNELAVTGGSPVKGVPPASNWNSDLIERLKKEQAKEDVDDINFAIVEDINIYHIMAEPWLPQYVLWHKTLNSRQYRLSDIYDASTSVLPINSDEKQEKQPGLAGGGETICNLHQWTGKNRNRAKSTLHKYPSRTQPTCSRHTNFPKIQACRKP